MTPINKIYHTHLCAICFEPYEKVQSNECLLLKCGHMFHEKCITEWIKRQSNCVMCQRRTFIPILLKDLLKEAGQKAIVGSKKIVTRIFLMLVLISLYGNISRALNCCFSNINEPNYFDYFRKPEGYLMLGFTILAILGVSSTFDVVKTLHQRRIRPLDVAEKISYKPSDE